MSHYARPTEDLDSIWSKLISRVQPRDLVGSRSALRVHDTRPWSANSQRHIVLIADCHVVPPRNDRVVERHRPPPQTHPHGDFTASGGGWT